MFENLLKDVRFDKPSIHSLVDLINQTYGLSLLYGDVQLVSVEEFVPDALTTRDLVELSTFGTRAVVRVQSDETDGPENFDITYLRLVLSAYMYRNVLASYKPVVPTVVVDYFETDGVDVNADARAYLKSKYTVQLEASEITLESFPGNPHPDGSYPVILHPVVDHPLWVGPVLLRAKPI